MFGHAPILSCKFGPYGVTFLFLNARPDQRVQNGSKHADSRIHSASGMKTNVPNVTNESVHNHETRSQSKLHMHSINLLVVVRSDIKVVNCLFNKLPLSLQGHMPSGDFKEDLYDYLIACVADVSD